jgi:hypothetical protein
VVAITILFNCQGICVPFDLWHNWRKHRKWIQMSTYLYGDQPCKVRVKQQFVYKKTECLHTSAVTKHVNVKEVTTIYLHIEFFHTNCKSD